MEVELNPSDVKDCSETGWLWPLCFGMSHCKMGSHLPHRVVVSFKEVNFGKVSSTVLGT